jgi:hypothetical protein
MLDYALFYAAHGWPVFPLAPGSKTPLPGSRGFKDATTDITIISRQWSTTPDANIGIATGDSGFFTVDIDPRNGGDDDLDALEAEHGSMPDTLEVMTGGGGTHRHYRMPEGVRIGGAKLANGIDIKSYGGYIVAPPSIHPETGLPYEWEASSDPTDGAAIVDAPQWLIDRLTVKEKPANNTALPVAGAILPRTQVLELETALDFLDPDDYDQWVKVGMALHSSGAGRQAYGIWATWSRGSEKFNDDIQMKKWKSFSSSGLNVESIFAWATEAGWVNPMDYQKQRFKEINKDLLAAANGHGPSFEVVNRDRIIDRTIPVPALASAADWIEQQLPMRQPYAVTQAVLSLASLMAGRHYISEDGHPAHTHLGIISRSVGTARPIKACIHRLIAGAGQRKMIRGSRIVSAQTLYKTLLRNPACHWVADDYGQLVAFARRQPSGQQEGALSAIADAYAADAIYIDQDVDPQALKSEDDCTIYNPSLSILALISENQLGGLAKRSEIGRGALEQMLCVCCPEPEPNMEAQKLNNIPQSVTSTIEKLRAPRRIGNLGGLSNGLQPASFTTVRFPADVRDQLAENDQQLLDLVSTNRYLTPLAIGAQQIMRRLLVALSAWRDPVNPVASVDLAFWLGGYIADHFAMFVERIQTASEDGKSDVYERVLEIIQEAGPDGVTQRDLARKSRPFRALKLEQRSELIGRMVMDDLVHEKKTGKTETLIDSRFVREVGK